MHQLNLLNSLMLVAIGDSQLRPLKTSKVSLRLRVINRLIKPPLYLKVSKALLLLVAFRVRLVLKDLLQQPGVLLRLRMLLSLLHRLLLQLGVPFRLQIHHNPLSRHLAHLGVLLRLQILLSLHHRHSLLTAAGVLLTVVLGVHLRLPPTLDGVLLLPLVVPHGKSVQFQLKTEVADRSACFPCSFL
jgi:hypothetical protein